MKLRVLLALLCALSLPAHGGEREDIEALRDTTVNLLRLLVQEGILTRDKADALIKEAAKRSAPDPAPAAAADARQAVRVPYVPEVVKQELREQIKQEVLTQARNERWAAPGSVPEWVDRIKWEGDLRVRYQRDKYDPANVDLATFQALSLNTAVDNTQFDRNRALLRARFGLTAKVSEDFTAGIRVATGNTNTPLSTNQTLGSGFNKYSVFLDRAYIRWHPRDWVEVNAGRIENPWLSTDLVWHDDLTFEGFAGTLKPRIGERSRGFLTLGAFPLQNSTPTAFSRPQNKWLYGAQVGTDWAVAQNTRLNAGLAWYDFQNYEGRSNSAGSTLFDATVPPSKQKGNTLFDITNPTGITPLATDQFALLSKFRLLNLTTSLDVANWDPVHLVVSADVVKNIGFNQNEIRNRTGITFQPRTLGWAGRIALGHPHMEKLGDWRVYAGYKYVQRDAVVDAFNDSDFHLGGTDAKGYYLGLNYGVDKRTWVTVRWLSANQIDGPPLGIDVLQFDLNVKF